ncbi:hypothetical protein GCM10028808_39550 [Spirosoma migulaei]
MQRRYTDTDLVKLLQSNDTRRHDEALADLYRAHKTTLIGWVMKHKGSFQDGEEIVADALMVFFTNVRAGTFALHDIKILAYLYGVIKRKWYNRLRDEHRSYFENLELEERQLVDLTDENSTSNTHQELFWELVERLNEKCRKLIIALVEGYSMQEIAQKLELKNADNAKAHKYQCMQRLNDLRRKGL